MTSRSSGFGGHISSMSIAGQSAAFQYWGFTSLNNGDYQVGVEFWVADVPTGTTGNIITLFTAQRNRAGMGLWAMYGAASSTPTDTDQVLGAADGSVTLTVPAKGVAVGASYNQSTSTCTWTGLTERYDTAIEGGNMHSGADLNSNAGGSVGMTADWAAGGTDGIHIFASWGP